MKLALEIAPSGLITSAEASGGHELLRSYALRNIKSWKFQPSFAVKKLPIKVSLIYEFKLSGTSDQDFERVTFDRERVLIEASPVEVTP